MGWGSCIAILLLFWPWRRWQMAKPVHKRHYHIEIGLGGKRKNTTTGKYGWLELEPVNLWIPDIIYIILISWLFWLDWYFDHIPLNLLTTKNILMLLHFDDYPWFCSGPVNACGQETGIWVFSDHWGCWVGSPRCRAWWPSTTTDNCHRWESPM